MQHLLDKRIFGGNPEHSPKRQSVTSETFKYLAASFNLKFSEMLFIEFSLLGLINVVSYYYKTNYDPLKKSKSLSEKYLNN